jgi:iron-sulfur cluster assembly protein
MIIVTDEAKNHVLDLMNTDGLTSETHFLRVGVKGGGCSGLTYVMDFDNEIDPTDQIVELTDLKVVIDRKSLLYLVGTELQYSTGLNGKGLVWNNPNSSRTCGCGESFSV